MKPKVALVKSGFLPAGSENTRGRLSGAAIAECERLVGEGWAIDGYSVVKSENTLAKSDGPAPVLVKKTATADPSRIADVPDESRPESVWRASTEVDGKAVPVGMRTVCNACHNSLTYCRCSEPRVWVDHDRQGTVNFHPIVQKG